MMSARSSLFSIISSYQRRRILERSLAVFLAQGLKAFSAASIASLVSFVPNFGTLAIVSPVAGLVTGISPVPIHAPLTKHWLLRRLWSLSFMRSGPSRPFGWSVLFFRVHLAAGSDEIQCARRSAHGHHAL